MPSERKIDDIAAGIAGIWSIIQRSHTAATPLHPSPSSVASVPGQSSPLQFEGESSMSMHSICVGRFMDATIRADCLHDLNTDTEKVLASLGHIFKLQDEYSTVHDMFFSESVCHPGAAGGMPPMEATVLVLRWAKGKLLLAHCSSCQHRFLLENSSYYIVSWLSQILPLDQITQVCQKVYFAVDDYTEVDFVLATGYLTWLFSEYAIVKGQPKYREYGQQCLGNLQSAITRLTLLLPATMEVIAALAVGVSDESQLVYTFS